MGGVPLCLPAGPICRRFGCFWTSTRWLQLADTRASSRGRGKSQPRKYKRLSRIGARGLRRPPHETRRFHAWQYSGLQRASSDVAFIGSTPTLFWLPAVRANAQADALMTSSRACGIYCSHFVSTCRRSAPAALFNSAGLADRLGCGLPSHLGEFDSRSPLHVHLYTFHVQRIRSVHSSAETATKQAAPL